MKKEVTIDQVQKMIKEECDGVRDLLIDKNTKYGNSAINPRRIFSKENAVEQIKVRIDDKLSRIQTVGSGVDGEDTIKDLIGYLILLRVATRLEDKD
jgi:hypothetical protein